METIGDALVYRLRGELLPLVRLSDVLRLSSEGGDVARVGHIVVLQAIGQRFGLIVDQIARYRRDRGQAVAQDAGSDPGFLWRHCTG